jgi:putative flavoprotein involved in K+ transport
MLAGNDTGEDLAPRVLAGLGATLTGRVVAADGERLRFAGDLAATLADADELAAQVKGRIDDPPEVAPQAWHVPAEKAPLRELHLGSAGINSIVWATGYRNDLGWIGDCPFDAQGYPSHRRGVSDQPGLYFIGLPWLRTRGSAILAYVGRDAEHIAGHIASRVQSTPSTATAVI